MTITRKPVTIRTQTIKKTEFRLVQREDLFYGMIDGKIIKTGEDDDEVWRGLLQDHGPATQRYFGINGARSLFLHHYPNGFRSDAYDKDGERGYKIKAKSILDENAPIDRAYSEKGFGDAVLSAFNATNLLSIYEKMRIKDALQSKQADDFVQSAARFALGEDRQHALRDMERALKDHGAAKWTSVTYLPFLWRPDQHMFLKPEATVDFAERTSHRFGSTYAPTLDVRIYDSLLDLARVTSENIADLARHDNIDVQSFIWVVSGAYDGEEPRP